MEGQGKTPFPEFSTREQCSRARSAAHPWLTLLVSAGDDTRRYSMSHDTERRPRRQVPWLGIASLLVTLARFLLDLRRTGQ
ncbi:hypothetical protein DEI84_06675 [Curtobacterium sp. MCBD17_023]|nr:hypothetical protein DEI84_06675 [Curtobacterium sp. MCBD17_023]